MIWHSIFGKKKTAQPVQALGFKYSGLKRKTTMGMPNLKLPKWYKLPHIGIHDEH